MIDARARSSVLVAALLCCACTTSESRDSDASPGQRDGAAAEEREKDDAGASEESTSSPVSAQDASDGATAISDAGEAALDAAHASDAQRDACASERCLANESCDDDHPCAASDTICVDRTCQADPAAPPGTWPRSAWSGRAGLVDEDDVTVWCTPEIPGGAVDATQPASVRSQLQRSQLDGTIQHEFVSNASAQRIRFSCFADATLSGAATVVTSAWSSDGDKDVARARCPRERPFAAFARCQLAGNGKPPFVYAGASCGDGVTGLAGAASLRGQLIGDHYELTTPNKPLFNNTGKAAVMGSDLGYQFLAQGRMYVGFGDTWENELQIAGPNGYRGSVLTYTHDFDPSDSNGIAFEGWETAPERPEIAREIVPSVHDQSGKTEFTAIATSGFGLSEGGAHYRFVWFASIKTWDPYTNNESTLAWSKDGAPFVRGDKASDVHPPRWPFDTHFGPAAIWLDRERGYVYFIGVRTYTPAQPLRLARVRATVASVLDHLQYEYWTGKAWQRPDPKDEYALARLADTAADLVPGSSTQNNRPEISVAYNPYVGRFIMMLQNDATPFADEAQSFFELWEAPAIEGPWKRAPTGEGLVLPPHHYGPYMSEQTFGEAGRDVYFALSEWDLAPLILGQPYVVGLWTMRLERRLKPGCEP